MAHHTMGPMGHGIPNPTGVDQSGVQEDIQKMLPGFVAMGKSGMSEHAGHVSMGLTGPDNTLPMMTGTGLYGLIEMGGMFTVLKVRDGQKPGDYTDPGFYKAPANKIATCISSNPDFGNPTRRQPYGPSSTPAAMPVMPSMESMPGMNHSKHGG